MAEMAQLPEVYQLKITLVDSEPEVWRRVLVPTPISLAQLHSVVQQAMGWEDLHDYRFRASLVDNVALGTEVGFGEAIAQIKGQPLYYTYDLASGWLHRIEQETPTAEKATSLPICLNGAAACPPENSGGVWGFDELMGRLENTDDPEYLDLLDKYGDFDPTAFDLAAANARLS